ncbi:MAG: tetratricopeptide repeat protein [Bacteroidaceae bacterium]|nr:tetratricopeptide repeat protein [Bacteroidaceae bacterium]
MKQISTIILLALLVACGSQREGATMSETQRRIATYVFGEAAKQYAVGNHAEAYDLLHQTLRLNPRHAPSLALLARYEGALRHGDKTDSLVAEALALDPTNPDYLTMDAALSDRSGNLERSIETYERLAAVKPRSSAVLGNLAQLYMKADMADSAISVMNRMEVINGVTEPVSSTKHYLYLQKGDTAAAMDELQRLVDEYPNDPNYAVLLGNAFARVVNKPDLAREIFDRVERIDPTNGTLQMARLNLYEHTDTARYHLYYDSLLYGKDTDTELRGRMMLRYVSEYKNDSLGREKTMAMFDSVLTMPQEDARLLSAYAAYLMAVKVGGDTLTNVLNRIIEVEPSNRAGLLQLIQCYARENNAKQIARVCDQAISYYPHEPLFYYYSALGHYQVGDTIAALDRLTDGIEHIDQNTTTEQVADMYSIKGDILHGLHRTEEAYVAYDSCLVYRPDDTMCMNNYAYFLSLEKRDLERAEQMSYRTVRAQPDSRTFLDTYAWILFQRGRYDEAATYMDKVMDGISTDCEEEPEDVSADVFEHAGDIYACNGDIERALSYWEAAKRLGCESKTLARKIKRKKYIAE